MMLNVRSILMGLTLTSALALSANAADIYVPSGPGGGYKDAYVPVTTWAGFYVGVNGGGAWAADNKDITFSSPVTGFSGTSHGFDSSGGFGGGQIGYNWQRGPFVFGVEADIQGSGIESRLNVTVPSNAGPLGVNAKQDVDYFGTVRGRLGYAFDRTLLYATGGFAYGGVRDHVLLANGGATALLSRDTTDTGFVVGGGIEHYFAPAWSAKLEYQFVDLGRDKVSGVSTNAVPLVSTGIDADFHTVRLGINYHFYNDYVPLK